MERGDVSEIQTPKKPCKNSCSLTLGLGAVLKRKGVKHYSKHVRTLLDAPRTKKKVPTSVTHVPVFKTKIHERGVSKNFLKKVQACISFSIYSTGWYSLNQIQD